MTSTTVRPNSRIAKFPKFIWPLLCFLRDKVLGKVISKLLMRPNLYPYHFDLVATNNNTDFMETEEFKKCYLAFTRAYGWDPGLPWRVHQFMWAVDQTRNLKGDWVEAGVGRGGLMSAALAHSANWNESGRVLHLFDTFLPWKLAADGIQSLSNMPTTYYAENLETTKLNFSKYERVEFHVGDVFETVTTEILDSISFLSIDLNFNIAEEHVLRTFWPKIQIGGVIILDDYAAPSRVAQRITFDKLSLELNFDILRTPSGQGIIIKTGE
jgi:hypothetical protein